jgi:hypothetical protein
MQQAHGTWREQTVEVVRNHEGGTRSGVWRRRAEGSLGSREWTSGVFVGSRGTSGRIPGEEGGDPARRESSEGEVKSREARQTLNTNERKAGTSGEDLEGQPGDG